MRLAEEDRGEDGRRLHPSGRSIALLVTGSIFANLIVLAQQMFVSKHDARQLTVLLVYAPVSHDLRTPLADLRGMVEPIDYGIVDDAETLRTYITETKHSVLSLGRLVDDLFELVQLDAVAIAAEAGRARLEAVVAAVVDSCRGGAFEKGLRVETSLGDAGQRLCSPRLTRVLQNLMQNAIRHTPADGTVRVEARVDTDRLEVVVADTGEGIPASQLSRVFEPFWRGDGARATPGAGLGLALAKRITETLGGDIHVDSSPREGTRFAVVLPD